MPDGKDGKGAFGGGLASDGQRLYATTAFGEALALDIATGSILWRKQIGSPIRSAPTVADGKMVFVSVANQVYCLSTADGTELWASQGVGESASVMTSTSAAIEGGIVVVPQTSGDVTTFRLARRHAFMDRHAGLERYHLLARQSQRHRRPSRHRRRPGFCHLAFGQLRRLRCKDRRPNLAARSRRHPDALGLRRLSLRHHPATIRSPPSRASRAACAGSRTSKRACGAGP